MKHKYKNETNFIVSLLVEKIPQLTAIDIWNSSL